MGLDPAAVTFIVADTHEARAGGGGVAPQLSMTHSSIVRSALSPTFPRSSIRAVFVRATDSGRAAATGPTHESRLNGVASADGGSFRNAREPLCGFRERETKRKGKRKRDREGERESKEQTAAS